MTASSATRILAFDLGGTRLKSGIVERGTGVVASFGVTDSAPDAETALAKVGAVGDRLRTGAPVDAVGLCLPGLVADDGRVLALPGKLAGIVGRNVTDWLRERFGLAAIVVNDAIAFGVGEAQDGAARGHDRAVVMTIGTGIGCCVLQDGAPITSGPLGGGLLGGQIPIAPATGGPLDTNGRHGTIEALCAAARIVDHVHAAGGAAASVPDVYAAWRAGDEAARAGIAAYQRDLVRALVALAHAHTPSVIVLGGGPAAQDAPVLVGLEARVNAALWPGYAVTVLPASLGARAALLGLAHWQGLARAADRATDPAPGPSSPPRAP